MYLQGRALGACIHTCVSLFQGQYTGGAGDKHLRIVWGVSPFGGILPFRGLRWFVAILGADYPTGSNVLCPQTLHKCALHLKRVLTLEEQRE